MYRTTIGFHDRLQRGQVPVVYALISTVMGWRGYAEKELIKYFEIEAGVADGSYDADGSLTAGSGLGLLEKSPRVVSWGGFERTIWPRTADVMASYTRKQQQRMSVTLTNTDHYFSKLLPKEPFLGRPLWAYIGFEDLPQSEHLVLFGGTIDQLEISDETLICEAIET